MVVLMLALSLAVGVLIIRKEEPDLQRLFGADYKAYCRPRCVGVAVRRIPAEVADAFAPDCARRLWGSASSRNSRHAACTSPRSAVRPPEPGFAAQ